MQNNFFKNAILSENQVRNGFSMLAVVCRKAVSGTQFTSCLPTGVPCSSIDDSIFAPQYDDRRGKRRRKEQQHRQHMIRADLSNADPCASRERPAKGRFAGRRLRMGPFPL